MSAVHKPNLRFDEETKVHVPYSEIMKGTLESAYDKFMRPKKAVAVKKPKQRKEIEIQKDSKTFNKWFK
jgi:hypothetical protein